MPSQQDIFCLHHYVVETTNKVESTSTRDFGSLADLDVIQECGDSEEWQHSKRK